MRIPDRPVSCAPQATPQTQLEPEKPKSSPLARFPSSRLAPPSRGVPPGDRPTSPRPRPRPGRSRLPPSPVARCEPSVAVALTATCWKKGATCAFSSWAQKRSFRSSWPRPSSSARPRRHRSPPRASSRAARRPRSSASRRPRSAIRYRYGAMGPSAFDCSGLVLYSYKYAGDYRVVGSGHYRSARSLYYHFRKPRPREPDRRPARRHRRLGRRHPRRDLPRQRLRGQRAYARRAGPPDQRPDGAVHRVPPHADEPLARFPAHPTTTRVSPSTRVVRFPVGVRSPLSPLTHRTPTWRANDRCRESSEGRCCRRPGPATRNR